MAKAEKQGLLDNERLKWFRNVNILGGIALLGAGVFFPQYQTAITIGAAVNFTEAGAGEYVRNRRKTRQRSGRQPKTA